MTHMLRHSLLLTTACCAGLALAAPALAQKEAAGIIQPKGGWAVTRIDNSSTQGGAYCTLARQYQNGIVFSVGRNKAEEYSVALDFQDSKLNAEKAYDITLKAGNQTRQLQMHPVNARAMVIRLGWDDSFFAALEKAQSMTATLDKDSYTLAMPEYTKGKTDLSECMTSLKTAGAGSTPVAAGTDVLSAESGAASGFSATKLAQADVKATKATPTEIGKVDPTKRPQKTNITELATPGVAGLASQDKAPFVAPMRSSDAVSLEAENEKLREQLNAQRQSYETRLAQNNQGNRVAELEEKLRLAESRGGSAAIAAPAPVIAPVPVPAPVVKEVVKSDPAQAQKIAELEQKVASLTRELAVKNDVTMKPATTPMPNPEQAKRITALQEEVAGLKAQLDASKKAPVPITPAVSPDTAKAQADAAAKVTELETVRKTYEARIATLESQLAAAQDNAGRKSVAAAVAPSDQENRQIASLQNEVKQKDAQVRAAQQRIAGSERELSQLRRQVSQVQRSDAGSAAPLAVSAAVPTPRGPSAMADIAPAASVAPVEMAAGGSGLKSILSRAGITAGNGTPTNGASEAYQWRNGAVSGLAQVYQGKGNALDVSQQYANAQRSVCTGDFASVPGSAQNGRVSIDIACVDGSGAKAQSLLFTEQGGQVLAFIINAPAEEMDQAMDARDKLNGNL